MNEKKSLISQKYQDITLLAKEEVSSIKKEIPWTHYILDDFIEQKAFKRMQQTILSKNHNFSVQKGDVNFVQFALLKYLPLAKVFYSIEFKSLLETLSATSLSINTTCLVQLRYMNQDSPGFPPHVDNAEFRSFVAVYYLSPNWVEGRGGELGLHSNEFEDESQAVVITPIENRLLCFFSDEINWHSIRKVNCWERYTVLSEWIVQNQE